MKEWPNNKEYKRILDLWKSLPAKQQIDALDKAEIEFDKLEHIDWYTKKVVLQAIGLI